MMGAPATGPHRRRVTLGAGLAIIAAAACSDVPSDPKVPFAIEFNRAPSPSVVLGDTMFDSLGFTAPLKARVFNSKGDEIVGAGVTYHVVAFAKVDSTNPAFADSVPLTVDATSGFVIGKTAPAYASKTARIYAQAGKLQSQTITVTATRSADALVASGAVSDSLMLSFLNTDSLLLSTPFSVRLRHTSGAPATAADSTVPAYLVRFEIVKPAGASTDTSYVMLTNGDRRRSELDTTDASGLASRQIRIRRVNFPFTKAAGTDKIVRDTILVRASAYGAGHSLVPGSGVEFQFVIKANQQ
jgi:hypothetical protein